MNKNVPIASVRILVISGMLFGSVEVTHTVISACLGIHLICLLHSINSCMNRVQFQTINTIKKSYLFDSDSVLPEAFGPISIHL